MNKQPATITAVIVPEGVVERKYEQTASRDHDVTLVAGVYPVTAQRSPEGRINSYWAAIPAVAHEHWASTVEFGGVALAGEVRGGETETYSFHVYSYDVDRIEAVTKFSFERTTGADCSPVCQTRGCNRA